MATKSKLAVLTKANVVDAGARGFVLFVEGIIDFINYRNLKELIQIRTENAIFEKLDEALPEKVEFRYCTEALIKNCLIDNKTLMPLLEKYGNSIVVAGSDKIKRLHIHTNNPAGLFNELRHNGHPHISESG